MSKHRLLIISSQAPYGGSAAKGALDMALTAASLELSVALLFIDDGCYQLRQGQTSKAIGQKNLEKQLGMLGLYDIEDCYACGNSLRQRGVNRDSISPSIAVLNERQVRALSSQFDTVIKL